ncbi:MAG: pentapeptide repeat-containing protein [Tildeniella nuda ZEHNDER 1965/U140]|jgi:uncharacterized protein YjbI with pentapeptide repeats|nr:pentapeptide repeat-containing protein [Tildeniella nuda ZEHNDER 1965/U140]
MIKQTSQTEITELPSPKEKDTLARIKKILILFKSDRWLAVAVYGSLTTIGLAIGTLAWNWSDLQTNPSEQSKRKFDASLSVVSTGATLAAGIVLFLNFRVANRNAEIAQKKLDEDIKKAERDEKLAQSRLTMERFNKAVEMLGKNDSIHLRLGGIYALESIAADSNKDAPDENYRQVLEVLTAFVRENAPYPPKEQAKQAETQATLTEQSPEAGENTTEELPPLPTDIQTVLTFLKRRRHKNKDWEQYPLDLRKADLRRAFLKAANLQKADLRNANLQEADLREANLQEVVLWNTNLQQADLWEANLQQSFLRGANLQQSFLEGTNLQQADLEGANLQEALLWEADLQKANLVEANLRGTRFWNSRLTETALAEAKEKARANLQSAQGWETAEYDPEIREWLGLPPETLEVE